MLISIDQDDSRPIYLQIIIQIKDQMRRGALKPGDELPSVRELADSLNINMHTARNAYLKLREEGLVNLRLGRRAVINQIERPADSRLAEGAFLAGLEELVTDALLRGLSLSQINSLIAKQLAKMRE